MAKAKTKTTKEPAKKSAKQKFQNSTGRSKVSTDSIFKSVADAEEKIEKAKSPAKVVLACNEVLAEYYKKNKATAEVVDPPPPPKE